ncbi:MAG: lytic transglycosylase domain-containing protein [Candidatus Acidiferrales bacterium]
MIKFFVRQSSVLPSPRVSNEQLLTRSTFAATLLVAVVGLALPAPTRAQIATAVDSSGKMTFINSNPAPTSQKAHSRSTIIAPAPAVPAQPVTPDVDEWPTPKRAPVAATPAKPAAPAVPLTADTEATGSFVKPIEPTTVQDPMDRIVQEAAQRHKVDPALVKAVISTESDWNPHAVSRKGAEGLMQLIPETAERFGVGNPMDPAQNVEGGTTYLRWLLDRYNGDLRKTLAAYNAGEGAVDQSRGVPRYRETQQYVQKVTHAYFQPGSGRNLTLWEPPRPPVRREVDSNGRVVFTNE